MLIESAKQFQHDPVVTAWNDFRIDAQCQRCGQTGYVRCDGRGNYINVSARGFLWQDCPGAPGAGDPRAESARMAEE